MKVIILAGGFGTRLSELTDVVPKPMVRIGGHLIIFHIMSCYARFGMKDFGIAVGYKGDLLKAYFTQFHAMRSDVSVDLSTGNAKIQINGEHDWRVFLRDTGESAMTGGRLLRMRDYTGDNAFMATYGDGLSNVNIQSLLDFHKSHGRIATLLAVRPTARFGELLINDNRVLAFQEKPQITEGWINGGFFVFEPEIFDYIESDDTVLEASPLETLSKNGELMAFKHEGFWQCMDTLRDQKYLDELCREPSPPWLVD